MTVSNTDPTRRSMLQILAGGAGSLAMYTVTAQPAQAELLIPDVVFRAMVERMGDRTFSESGKNLVLTIPTHAETGLSVPATVSVPNSPMTPADHITSLHMFTELNPQPYVADYYLTPRSGKAEITTRIRLARSQFVYAGAIRSDGTAWITAFYITVNLGACAADIFLPDAAEAVRRRQLEGG
jgi:sulfur-oxidizing protein SoxY